MRVKSHDVALIVPVCTAAALLSTTEAQLRATAEGQEDQTHAILTKMAWHVKEAMDHLVMMREIYDRELT